MCAGLAASKHGFTSVPVDGKRGGDLPTSLGEISMAAYCTQVIGRREAQHTHHSVEYDDYATAVCEVRKIFVGLNPTSSCCIAGSRTLSSQQATLPACLTSPFSSRRAWDWRTLRQFCSHTSRRGWLGCGQRPSGRRGKNSEYRRGSNFSVQQSERKKEDIWQQNSIANG